MMKKIKYLILTLLIPAFISCEDFLDKQPTDQLSPATFWKTEQDATMALAGVYRLTQFQGIGACRRLSLGARVTGIAHWDVLTDNAYAFNNHARIRNIANGIHNSTTGGFVSTVYYGAYKGIAACNNFLANIDNVEGADPDLITQYKAEVRFCRAFLYYWLTQVYGDVPLVTSPLSVEEMNIPRTPKADVLSSMYEDLDYAIANLPDEVYDGHAVKSSAQAFKARVKLFNGEYQEAASLSKQVIDGNLYLLAEDYRANFAEDFDQDNCPEIIFSFKYLGPSIPNEMDLVIGWWDAVAPLHEYMDSHEPGDMRRIWNAAGVGEVWPIGKNQLGWEVIPEEGFWITTQTALLKWSNPSSSSANWAIRGNDVPHIRLAEVLLVYAEAKNESTGPDASVHDAVNRVRQRSGLDDLAGLSQEEMRQKIRHERRVELAFEAQRYFDLLRWDIAKDIIPTLNDPPDQTDLKRPWEDRFMLWPIPQDEIDKDPENIKQNPGWG